MICGGGWRFFPSLFVTIACIRKTGCTLPIQVWFLGDRGEFDLRMLRALEPFQVGWICGNSFCREHGIPRRLLGGWELKPLAAAYCPYKEVLSLDADSYPAYKDTFHLSWRFCGHDVCVPTQVPGWHVCAFIPFTRSIPTCG